MGAAGAGLDAGQGAGPGAPRPGAEAAGAAARAPNAGGMSAAERMMAKMGYVRGKGLGKDEQGITTALAVDGAGVAGRGVIVDADAERRCEARGRARDWARPRACTCVPPALTRGAKRRRRTRVVALSNMVGAGAVDAALRAETKEECSSFGKVLGVRIFERPVGGAVGEDDAVRIFVRFAEVRTRDRAVAHALACKRAALARARVRARSHRRAPAGGGGGARAARDARPLLRRPRGASRLLRRGALQGERLRLVSGRAAAASRRPDVSRWSPRRTRTA